jgi:transcriptional regulator with XRE-family HTH domain
MAMRPKPTSAEPRAKLLDFPPSDGPDPVDVHVGQRVRLRRSMLGISQTQLAKSVGLTFQAIQKYERGENRISASRLHQFAQILGVPVASFFEGLPNEQRGEGASFPSESEWMGLSKQEIQQVLRAFGAIKHPRLRKSFLKVLKESAACAGDGDDRGRSRKPL